MNRVLPMLFNTNMVQAILDGRKTVTRRVIKKEKVEEVLNSSARKKKPDIPDKRFIKCLVNPPCDPGDILYVRETWSTKQSNECFANKTGKCPYDNCEAAPGPCFGEEYIYKATDKLTSSVRKWHPSIHMPKEAARIWLKVTDVRVEKLQDIKPEDAIKEGTKETFPPLAHDEFREIWNSTVKKPDIPLYGWEANSWAWVIEFKRCDKYEPSTDT